MPQDIDYPALRLEVNRQLARPLWAQLQGSASQRERPLLTSGGMIAPSYFVDPVTGNDYILTVESREGRICKHLEMTCRAIPLRSEAWPPQIRAARCRHRDSQRQARPTEVNHYQLRRVIDVYVAPSQRGAGAPW